VRLSIHFPLTETVPMSHAHGLTGRARATAAMTLLVLGGFLVGGCASTAVQAQWTNPSFAGQSLRGATVLVVCDASDAALTRLCKDHLAAQVAAAGATPIVAPDVALLTTEGGRLPEIVFEGARQAGVQAIVAATIAPDATVVSPGPTLGVGFGGFSSAGGGYRSSGIGTGVGVAVPVGAVGVMTAYGAHLTLTDVATGRLMWASRVTTPASSDVAAQVSKLAQAGREAAQQAGFF
jgi:hypothetical protein